MSTINYASKEIFFKIVYYGCGLSGKTTNLQQIHSNAPSANKGNLVSLATETDRTLFFDFLPIDAIKIGGFSTKFQLYTVPGQVHYNATRKLVLRGVDGIVFVADSPEKRIALQIVGRRTEISELDDWGDRTPRTQIVAIGAPINADELSNQFDRCIAHD